MRLTTGSTYALKADPGAGPDAEFAEWRSEIEQGLRLGDAQRVGVRLLDARGCTVEDRSLEASALRVVPTAVSFARGAAVAHETLGVARICDVAPMSSVTLQLGCGAAAPQEGRRHQMGWEEAIDTLKAPSSVTVNGASAPFEDLDLGCELIARVGGGIFLGVPENMGLGAGLYREFEKGS